MWINMFVSMVHRYGQKWSKYHSVPIIKRLAKNIAGYRFQRKTTADEVIYGEVIYTFVFVFDWGNFNYNFMIHSNSKWYQPIKINGMRISCPYRNSSELYEVTAVELIVNDQFLRSSRCVKTCWRNKMRPNILYKLQISENITFNTIDSQVNHFKLDFQYDRKIIPISIWNVFYASWLYDKAKKKQKQKSNWNERKKYARMNPHNEQHFSMPMTT